MGDAIWQKSKIALVLKLSVQTLRQRGKQSISHIENEGTIPSLPVVIQFIKICGLPVEHYFNPEVMREESEDRKRVSHKLKLCPEQYLPIVEGAIDGALKIKQPEEETEGE